MVNKTTVVVFLIFVLTVAIHYLSSGGLTAFEHFALLADAFLKKHLYVSAQAPWLEQVPIDSSHFYVPYPPLPALLLIPFRAIFGSYFFQDYLSYFLGSAMGLITVLISLQIKKDIKLAIWSGLLGTYGTIMWYMSSVGSSWYLGQICSVFFISLAIFETLTKKRYFLIGIFIGVSYLSRIETIVTLPFFLFLAFDKLWFKNFLKIASGIAPFVLFNFYYNFARFGVIWDKAYLLIPGVSNESWFSKGVINIAYIPEHLKIIFKAVPELKREFPFATPGLGGLAIWFTTPAFIYSLLANLKERIVQLSWLSILLISIIVMSHGSTGFAQFGYRFAVDFYPFLILLTIKGVAKTGVKWHHWLLLSLSILVNLWGVLFLNIIK